MSIGQHLPLSRPRICRRKHLSEWCRELSIQGGSRILVFLLQAALHDLQGKGKGKGKGWSDYPEPKGKGKGKASSAGCLPILFPIKFLRLRETLVLSHLNIHTNEQAKGKEMEMKGKGKGKAKGKGKGTGTADNV